MAFMYNRRPFSWRGRSEARGPRRTLVWIEELESRQVLATLTGPFLLVPPPTSGATTPTLVAPGAAAPPKPVTTPASAPPTNLTTGTGKVAPFIVVNGQSATSPSLASPATPATLPQTPGIGTPINPAPPGPLSIPLPPILQGATVVPTAGPLTFADLQTITANFIGGGHHETAAGSNVRPFNPPSTPRPLPSANPAQQSFLAPDSAPAFLTEMLPLQTTEALVPLIAGFEEGPQLIGDQTEEVLQRMDGSVGLRLEASAAPVLVGALAAHWADRHRRPDEEEKDAEAGKARLTL